MSERFLSEEEIGRFVALYGDARQAWIAGYTSTLPIAAWNAETLGGADPIGRLLAERATLRAALERVRDCGCFSVGATQGCECISCSASALLGREQGTPT